MTYFIIPMATERLAFGLSNGMSGLLSGFMGGFMGLVMYFRMSKKA